ncbi:MAG: hypothetical protein ACI93B_002167 [Yoonia sp.]|jgi:hypothetical protein
MAAMGRNFYINFVVCPKADLGVHCSIRKFGLSAAIRSIAAYSPDPSYVPKRTQEPSVVS